MDRPLLISSLLEFAIINHPTAEIVSRRVEGGIHRYTWREVAARSAQLAHALGKLGIQPGERVASLAWNTHRHLELYFGVSGTGAVLHTVNPRLFPQQIIWIVNHAEDRVLFMDLTFVPMIEHICPHLPKLEKVVLLCGRADMPAGREDLLCYEDLIADAPTSYDWPALDERSAGSMCYTSGTTGNPKGVVYSHRSTVLHAMGSLHKGALDISRSTVVLPVVPMFHVNAWGVPYSAAMSGAKLVMPGAGMDGKSLHELIDSEQVNLLLGVPSVWLGLLNYLDTINAKMESVKHVVVGGSAAPYAMIKAFDVKHDAFLIHAWGMTEMSPLGTVNAPTPELMALPAEERYQRQLKQGRPIYGVDLKIVNDDGIELPRDGKTYGRLLVRGPWIASSYYKHEDKSAFVDGWFDTGDVATLDELNTMQIVDRRKDVIKSGGEWISSIDLENAAVGHPAVREACVIGVAHPKWDERPLLLVVLKDGQTLDKDDMLKFLLDHVAKWWLPDDVIVVPELPHTATGKLLKVDLRAKYHDWLMK
jgi:fatty-acyl-CoA synthase